MPAYSIRVAVERLAELQKPGGLSEGALGHQKLGAIRVAAADSGTVLYNLLLDGDHAYWIVQDSATPLLQSISHTPESAAGTDKAFLVHNKG